MRAALDGHWRVRQCRARLALLLALIVVASVAAPASAATSYRTRHFDLADLGRNELTWSAEKRLGFPVREPTDRHGVPMVRRAGGV